MSRAETAIVSGVTAAVMTLVGLLVIWLAAPRAIAAFQTAAYGLEPNSVPVSETTDPVELDEAAAALREALSWTDNAETWSQLGFVYGYRAELADASADLRTDYQTRAAQATTEALARAPVEPGEWMRLALLRAKLSRPLDEVAAALRMSFYTGPKIPELAIPRLRLAFVVWDALAPDAQQLVESEVRFAWNLENYNVWRFGTVRTRLIRVAMDTGALDRVRSAMNRDPIQRLEFERALVAYLRQS